MIVRTVVGLCVMTLLNAHNVDEEILSFDTELSPELNLTLIGSEFIKYPPYNEKFLQGFSQLHFSYNPYSIFGPSRWHHTFPKCNGQRQSPINLPTKLCLDRKFPTRLQHLRAEIEPKEVTIENNGYTIEMSFDYKGERPLLVGGLFKSAYVFEQIHFHWGRHSGEGTEHQIGNRRFDLEMHIVHRNAKYPNITAASEFPDGIVAIGILARVSHKGRNLMMLRNLDQLKYSNSSVKISGSPDGFRMLNMAGSLNEPFIAYKGSLTTPPCSESVLWLVAKKVRVISYHDIKNLREISTREGEPIAPNLRPIQDSNGRACMFI